MDEDDPLVGTIPTAPPTPLLTLLFLCRRAQVDGAMRVPQDQEDDETGEVPHLQGFLSVMGTMPERAAEPRPA